MGFTTDRRLRVIDNEQVRLQKDITAAISSLEGRLTEVMNFTAFALTSLLAQDGDVDATDMVVIGDAYSAKRAQLDAIQPKLNDISGLRAYEADGVTFDPTTTAVNLQAFIDKYSIDLMEYSKRFD